VCMNMTFNKMNSADNFDLDYGLFKEHSQSTMISDETHSGSEAISGVAKSWSHVLNQPDRSANDSLYRKPTHSYSSLISEAIRLSVKGQLTLNEIYTWLVDKFPYFKAAGTGWKNSIRHTLSTNQKFVRVPRPAKEPGKGAYWTIRDIDRPTGRLNRKPSYVAKPDDNYVSPRTSSSSGSSDYFEAMPAITYSQDFESSRQIHGDSSPQHYQHVYLPPFQASDKNTHVGLLPTLPPPTMALSHEMPYSMDSAYPDYATQTPYSMIPRMPLSRESSSLFDDWTANSSISNFRLSPLNLNLPKEVESLFPNSS